jgi:acyl dehydratase
VRGISMGINYGLDKVRFPNPVRVGSRVRASAELGTVEAVKGGVQAKIVITIEIEGQEKPACVAEKLVRYFA